MEKELGMQDGLGEQPIVWVLLEGMREPGNPSTLSLERPLSLTRKAVSGF